MAFTVTPIIVEIKLKNMQELESALNTLKKIREKHPDIKVRVKVRRI
ncbi:MAG: hypothetical protein HFG46_06660 [Clostridium sp.]|jgi:hypothetical protein|nr:hypothetical protein [Clostridium sp.]